MPPSVRHPTSLPLYYYFLPLLDQHTLLCQPLRATPICYFYLFFVHFDSNSLLPLINFSFLLFGISPFSLSTFAYFDSPCCSLCFSFLFSPRFHNFPTSPPAISCLLQTFHSSTFHQPLDASTTCDKQSFHFSTRYFMPPSDLPLLHQPLNSSTTCDKQQFHFSTRFFMPSSDSPFLRNPSASQPIHKL